MARTPKPKTTEQMTQDLIKGIKHILKRSKHKEWAEVPISIYFEPSNNGPVFGITACDYNDYENVYFEKLTEYQLETICRSIIKTFSSMPNMEVETGNRQWWLNRYGIVDITYPKFIRKMGKPCKEFKELQKLVQKKYGIELKLTTLYEADLSGKKGRYDEDERLYTAYNPEECIKLIERIKAYGRKRTKCQIKTFDDIETEYASRYELDNNGMRYVSLVITST